MLNTKRLFLNLVWVACGGVFEILLISPIMFSRSDFLSLIIIALIMSILSNAHKLKEKQHTQTLSQALFSFLIGAFIAYERGWGWSS